MTQVKNTEPAFPESGLSGLPNGEFIQGRPGMSLRDYFAAKALPTILALYCEDANINGYGNDWKRNVAINAYAMADAMLKARENTDGTV